MPFRLSFLILFFLLTILTKAQTFSGKKFGLNIGLLIAAGTHFDRIGISCAGYYTHETYQFNPGFKIYYNFKNIGPSKKYFEFAASVGAIISYGSNDSLKNLFISPAGNQTIKRNSVGYAFNYYLNHIKTSQATGTVSLQFGKFQIICEDDLFAGGIRDEFRTGSILAQYHDRDFQYGINFFTGWTGKRGRHTDDPNYPSRNGYMDMTHSLYGNISAGLFSAQIQYAASHGQIIQGSIGIDAEQVRNFFQNKLVHQLFFSPKKGHWRGGADLPMIDSEGKMYLYKKGQKIRPATLYANLFANPNLFY
ncbi:MAG: polymorphic toxin type 23 domain-containing protein [Ginsengibacter sp.]